jgi:Zn-dependent metalloprotease
LKDASSWKCRENIGNDKGARVWYKALTDFMTQSTNYHQARIAALDAATALYGNG